MLQIKEVMIIIMHQDLTVSVSEMRVILKRMYLLVRRGMQYVSLLAGGMHWVI